MPGLSSQAIDPRLSFEPSEDGNGIIWDSTKKRFVVGSGDEAIKEFIYDDSLDAEPVKTESRNTSMQYADESNWIWNFSDGGLPTYGGGPTVIPVTSPPAVAAAASPVAGPPPPPSGPAPPTGVLDPPAFSIKGGKYAIRNFDMTVSLADTNAAGLAQIVYSIDYGPWNNYTGAIDVPPGSTLSAQAVPLLSGWQSSTKKDETYEATPEKLRPPVIDVDQHKFGLFKGKAINVTLTNPNPSSYSRLRYSINRGPWIDHTSPFELRKQDYPDGADIEAQAVSIDSPYYLPSTVNFRDLPFELLELSGNIVGSFHDPTGDADLVTNLAGGGSNSYFEWGDDRNGDRGYSRSTLDFTGGSFSGVEAGQQFQIGSLDYYNGTILSGTGADTVDLTIGLSLDVNGYTFNPYFDFTFDLVNTANHNDPNNPWPDADFVYLQDARASRTLIINDTEFEFRLEFGETTTDGFASFDEFHVLEERSSQVNLYGTFIELGPVDFSTDTDNSIDTTTVVTDSKTGDAIAFQDTGYVDSEEGAKQAFEDTKDQKDIAKRAREAAEGYEDDAAKASKNALDDLASDKLSDATAETQKARDAADAAIASALEAETAALRARQLASDANTYALFDLSAQDEAQKALEEAAKAEEEYKRARVAAQNAEMSATTAEAAVAAYTP